NAPPLAPRAVLGLLALAGRPARDDELRRRRRDGQRPDRHVLPGGRPDRRALVERDRRRLVLVAEDREAERADGANGLRVELLRRSIELELVRLGHGGGSRVGGRRLLSL